MIRILQIFIIACALTVAGKAQNDTVISIYFETDSDVVSQKHKDELRSFISSHVIQEVSVAAYCDDRGSVQYNLYLSEDRVDSAVDAVIEVGLDEALIITMWAQGEVALDGSDDPEAERASHRRADVRFFFTSESVSQDNDDTPNIDLKDLQVGDKIILENILFEGGRHVLLEESYPSLQYLTTLLLENTQYHFAIQGHVCCTAAGDDGLDMDTGLRNLSEARAKVIYDYLASKGVAEERMTHEGFGGDFPLGGEDKYDRRVELLVTDIVYE